MAQRKKSARPLLGLQPLFPVERLVANEGWVTSPVKAVSRRRRGPKARLYRACHPARLGHRGRRLATARPLRPPSLRGFTPPVTFVLALEWACSNSLICAILDGSVAAITIIRRT